MSRVLGLLLIVRLAHSLSVVPRSPFELSALDKTQAAKVSAAAAATLFSQAGEASAAETSVPNNVHDDNDDLSISRPLGADAYSDLDGMRCSKIVNGMWQVSGAHGFTPEKDRVVKEMAKCVSAGFTTFDLADIYGPAEEFVGSFRKGPLASDLSKESRFFTKWVPRPQTITKAIATAAIDKSLRAMNTDRLDLIQLHAWDYNNPYYFDAMAYLMELQQNEKIRSIGLCNFDTEHMLKLIDQDAPIVSNQVAFSLIDDRPLKQMIPACLDKNVKLLVYGTLLGGFLSSDWLGKPEPRGESLTNVSLRKYLPWINFWGGWGLFQQLLQVLDTVGKKHQVSISNVALRWVIDQPTVAGALVGVRFGLKEHIKDNERVFSFKLDDQDLAMIKAVRDRGSPLYNVFGDCGGEYHARAR